jgi:hypothetical protein
MTTANGASFSLRSHLRRLLPVGLGVGIVTGVGLYNAVNRSIGLDERFSLETARRSFVQTIARAIEFEAQAPLYFLLLHFWLRLADNLLFARLLSTLCVALAVIVMHRLWMLISAEQRVLSLPLLAALLPAVLWTASEARGYALTLLLASLICWLFTVLWIARTPPRPAHAAWYVLVSCLAVYTSYYAGFLVAACALAASLCGRRRTFVIRSHLAIAVALLPLAAVVPMQVSVHATYVEPPPFAVESGARKMVTVASWAVRSVFHGAFPGIPYFGSLLAVRLLALAIIGAVLVGQWGSRRPYLGTIGRCFLLLAAVPTGILLSLQGLELTKVAQRHWTFALPGGLAVLGVLIGGVPRRTPRLVAGVAMFALFGTAAVQYQRVCGVACVDDWRGAGAFIEKTERPGEPILIFTPYAGLQFREHYHGRNQWWGIPEHRPWMTRHLRPMIADTAVVTTEVFRQAIAHRSRQSETFWLILWYAGQDDIVAGQLLQGYLCEHTKVEAYEDFTGTSLSAGLYIWRLTRLGGVGQCEGRLLPRTSVMRPGNARPTAAPGPS